MRFCVWEKAMIVLHRKEPAKNISRFYALSVEQTLFGYIAAVRRWGRIGSHGQRQELWFSAADQAQKQLAAWARAKAARGYLPHGC
jgi:predicted DNA-binding WGR domain protein